MSELARDFYNKIADTYEAGYQDAYWRLYDQITAEILSRYMPHEPSLILDAGGGTGRWAAAMGQAGHRVMLVDISEKMLDVAKERINNSNLASKVIPIHADMRQLKFDDSVFDLVISLGDPISYCGDDFQMAINELVRVAKRGAPILASVDNRYHLALRIIDKFELKEAVGHLEQLLATGNAFTDLPVHAFTLDELRASFKQAGAEVENAYGKHTISSLMSKEKRAQLEDGEVFAKFEKLEKTLMDKPELIGFAGHILVVARKF